MILHERTRQHIEQFIANPSHALLLVGPHGTGKTYVATHLLARLLNIDPGLAPAHPALRVISPEKNSISIDVVRELQRFLQLKTTGKRTFRRAVLIEHAETLTTEAQNAFLKILEEPPSDTVILLTASTAQGLLPTICSRLQTISIHAPEGNALKEYFAEHAPGDVTQAFFLSGGLPGLMHALLGADTQHTLLGAVDTAKQVLQQQTFQRLTMVDAIAKDKEQAQSVLEAVGRIAQAGLSAATSKADEARIKQWHRILANVQAAREALAHNGNTKLVLTNFMLQL